MYNIALTKTGIRCIKNSPETREWFLDGQLHRLDGPAFEHSDGTKKWYINNKLHRVDGPAIEYPSGTKYWYLDGKRHRIDGPASEWEDGTKEWYLNDKRHRVDGPAIDYPSGRKVWFLNGKRHRVDGPAIEDPNEHKYWYLNGRELKESEYFSLLRFRKFRSQLARFNNALDFNLKQTLKLSRNRAAVEWYYSPDCGGGKLAKTRLEHMISYIDYFRSN